MSPMMWSFVFIFTISTLFSFFFYMYYSLKEVSLLDSHPNNSLQIDNETVFHFWPF